MSVLHDYTYRIVVLGDSNVGKTHIMSNYVSNKHISNQIFTPTIGVDFHAKLITTCSKKIKLHIWDTSGDQNFKRIVQAYYMSVAAAIIVYDITNRESFEHIKEWLEGFREKNHKLCDIPILVVGNYPNKKKLRLVRKHELETFGELYNTMIAEVDSFEMTYLQNIFQPLWNKLTNTFVIPEKYNPGIKCLKKNMFLPKTSSSSIHNPIHIDTPKKIKTKTEPKDCIIS
tara:strand:- start:1477 stop:2163 length:687 start_codon:yes stop_codon:yes gene_type:complete